MRNQDPVVRLMLAKDMSCLAIFRAVYGVEEANEKMGGYLFDGDVPEEVREFCEAEMPQQDARQLVLEAA